MKEIKIKHIKNTFVFAILIFSLSLVFPENLRNIPVFLLLATALLAIFHPLQSRNKIALRKATLIQTLFFIVMLLSVVYSANTDYAIKRIMVMASLFILPMSFYAINLKSRIDYSNISNKLYVVFFISSVVFFIGVLIQNYFHGFLNESIFTHYPERINSKYGKYSMHPLYASMYISISLLFGIRIYHLIKKRSHKLLFFLSASFLVVILILLARKSVILFTLIAFFIYFIKTRSKKNVMLFAVAFFILLVVSSLIPPIRDRFLEVIKSIAYVGDMGRIGSTTIRLNIYELVLNAISENVIFGYGIGDTKNVLMSYYETRPEVFNGKYYNSHNQFLSAWLSSGILGIIALVTTMVYNFKLAIKSQDFVYLSIIIMFTLVLLIENILERQAGVLLFSFLINFFAFRTLQEPTQ